jgi:Pyruvate/2-oxoacid:ferredoxin oxidoreductase delta subunit
MKRGREPYTPSAEQRALMPSISGNAINGLGERTKRRPSQIYWHRPEALAFGRMQEWMVENYNRHPLLTDIYRRAGDRGPRKPDPVAPERVEAAPEQFVAELKAFALAHDADLVGIARLDPAWVFEGYEVKDPWIVVLGVAMDHAALSTVPEATAAVEIARQYNRGARAAALLANWIRGQGYDATPHGGPWAGSITLIPPALASGFGELGKHGSIINRTYGSAIRLAAVTTELPLVADAPDTFGADDFCASCQVCSVACPPQAIGAEKQWVRGVEKWYVDFDKCLPYFNESYGCGICIAVCPWSKPGTAPALADKMTRRRAKRGA